MTIRKEVMVVEAARIHPEAPWTPWIDAHLDLILEAQGAKHCVGRGVMSRQERLSDLCKLQAEPGMQPRRPDSTLLPVIRPLPAPCIRGWTALEPRE